MPEVRIILSQDPFHDIRRQEDALAGIRLPQHPDLVLCAVSLSFAGLAGVYASVASWSFGLVVLKTNTPPGSNPRGHVSRHEADDSVLLAEDWVHENFTQTQIMKQKPEIMEGTIKTHD